MKEIKLMLLDKTRKTVDFCVAISAHMVECGANLERVQLALELICRAYGFTDVSIFLLSSHISLSVKDREGNCVVRQATIPPASLHMERLKRLNRLSYNVVNTKPQPYRLEGMLSEAMDARDYSDKAILAAQIAAMICLCLIFGGSAAEVASVAVITLVIHYLAGLLRRIDVNHLVTSALTMTIATLMVYVLFVMGICQKETVAIITISMLFIPGIPLVNAVRNLLCDHEMNGILQTMKVLFETAAIGTGIYFAVFLCAGDTGFGDHYFDTLADPVLLVILSFFASASFGIVFRIPPHDLVRAGLGGVIARIALLALQAVTPYRILYVGLAALAAELYAEFLATRRKDPATYFVYPAIIPLIPGDLFFRMIMGFLYTDWDLALTNGYNCLIALLGMSIGFVLSSAIAHYVRKMRHGIHSHRHKH